MLPRRLAQLFAGLILYGLSLAVMYRAAVGLAPWDVFHQGAAERIGWSFGTVTIATGVVVLLLWIPLRERPGVGTIANVVVVGLAADAGLALIPELDDLALRIPVFAVGLVLNGVATGAYIGARLGPGPRDGLMTGLARRTGGRIGPIRTGIELTVLACGWLLGGDVGPGTVVYAVAIGPLTAFFLPLMTVPEKPAGGAPPPPGAGTDPGAVPAPVAS
jgi:uncharacterized membrane protein YczE